MSTTAATSSTTPVNASGNAKSSSGSSSTIDMTTFLTLLTSELTNQDPLNPVSNAEFASQLAQLGMVQGIDSLNNNATVIETSALLGKHVIATRPAGSGSTANVDGTVVRMSVQKGVYYMGIKESDGTITDVKSSAILYVENNTSSSSS